jgi:hypothetical protein
MVQPLFEFRLLTVRIVFVSLVFVVGMFVGLAGVLVFQSLLQLPRSPFHLLRFFRKPFLAQVFGFASQFIQNTFRAVAMGLVDLTCQLLLQLFCLLKPAGIDRLFDFPFQRFQPFATLPFLTHAVPLLQFGGLAEHCVCLFGQFASLALKSSLFQMFRFAHQLSGLFTQQVHLTFVRFER